MDGTVIDVRVFTRDGVEKDSRALSIERQEIERVRKDLDDTLRILEDDIYDRVEKMLVGKKAAGGPNKLKADSKITKATSASCRATSGSRSASRTRRPRASSSA
jgi:DNA-directed RNA polymerase subunit beta